MAELSNYGRPNVTYDLNLILMHLLSSDPREYHNNPASENSKHIFSYPLDNGLTKFGIDEYTRIDSRVHVNSIENLYWFHSTINCVTHMLNQLQIHNCMECFSDMRTKVTALVVETAKAATRNPEGFKSFIVVATLEVDIIKAHSNADSYDTHISVKDSDDQNIDTIDEYGLSESDEYGMSESDDELDLAVEQRIEDMKVRGADSLAKNSTGTTADCVVFMDNFKVGTMITYMPYSHFFSRSLSCSMVAGKQFLSTLSIRDFK
ncbi:hypothetical protein MKX01_037050 [Papaver californicum]|nr:hypothetical protein MKX01_037050 [Papaver californicum]